MIAFLVWLIVLLCVLALVFYLIRALGIPEPVRTVILVVLALVCLLWLVSQIGVFGPGPVIVRG